MFRRSALLAATGLIAALALPAAANAVIAPDPGWGMGGTSSNAVQCPPDKYLRGGEKPAFGGTVYLWQNCVGGATRIIKLGTDGQIDATWGTDGHVQIQVPSMCRDAVFGTRLEPVTDGALYAVFGGTANVDTHFDVCIAKITAEGDLVDTYGGSTALRKLSRNAADIVSGTAVDEEGRLLLFSQRLNAANWKQSATFINRWTTAGKPDLTFSGDGQVVHQEAWFMYQQLGDVVGNSPVVAIRSVYGTAFARYTEAGKLDKTFGKDGRRWIKTSEVGGGHVVDAMAVDGFGRIGFVVHKNAAGTANDWFDLQRLTKGGDRDATFGTATERVNTPPATQIVKVDGLAVMPGNYVIQWRLNDGSTDDMLTGFESSGDRWLALGVDGTVEQEADAFAPDEDAFYEYAEFDAGGGATDVEITRNLIS